MQAVEAVRAKVKAKAKGKGKAKGKAAGKAKGKAKAQARAPVVEAPAITAEELEEQDQVDESADVDAQEGGKLKPKPKASSLRKKVLDELGDKSVEDAIAERKFIIQQADTVIAEAAALAAAQENQVKELQAEFDKARAEVEAAMELEQDAATAIRHLKEKQAGVMGKADEARKTCLEAQKKVDILTAMAEDNLRIKQLEEAKQAAIAATEAAKKDLIAQRQRQKEAMEATRVALAEAKAAAKGGSKGQKRMSGAAEAGGPKASPKARRASAAAPVVQDGEDIE